VNKLIETIIYLIYGGVAALSIAISYRVSLILCLMVIPIELLRILAIYKRLYKFLMLVIAFNLSLVAYTSYSLDNLIKEHNQQVDAQNNLIKNYVNKTWLKAETAQKFINSIEFKQADVNYLVIIAVYLGFELLVLLFLKELNKQIEFEQKLIKKIKPQEKPKTKAIKPKPKAEEQQETLKFVGSYLEYAKANNISRRKAQKLFEEWAQQNLLITKNRKKYLKIV